MDYGLTNEEKALHQAKVRRAQLDLLSVQSDRNRLMHKQVDLIAELRRLHLTIEHLKTNIEDKTTEEHQVSKEIERLDEMIAHTKKAMNTL
ncbi:MAG: hypothetical protein ACSLEX_02890 [Minisyncoccota bacterium]